MWGRLIIGGILMLLLAAALVFTAGGWARAEGIPMSTGGIVALVLGAVMSLAVGGGLMTLLFHSARKGYDDQVQDYTKLNMRPPGTAAAPAPETDPTQS